MFSDTFIGCLLQSTSRQLRRYVELFLCSRQDMEQRLAPKMGGGGSFVQMRGLPFSCSENDIAHFFGLRKQASEVAMLLVLLAKIVKGFQHPFILQKSRNLSENSFSFRSQACVNMFRCGSLLLAVQLSLRYGVRRV